MTVTRQPAGIPIGGQFAASAQARADIALAEDLFGELGPVPQPTSITTGDDLTGQDFSYRNLTGEQLIGANAQGVSFHSANLTGADLSGIDARGANFTKAELSGVFIDDANFSGACFRDANLMVGMNDASFRDANLAEAVIGPATRVDFSGADLRGAKLSGFFEGCDFRGADFDGAWLRGRQHASGGGGIPMTMPYEGASFLDCQFDDDLDVSAGNFPDGFDPARDAAFRDQGFSADDTARWVEEGIDDADTAAAFRDAGFDERDAADWHAAEMAAADARAYRDAGISEPHTAADWHAANIPADEVTAWEQRGFSAGSHLTPVENARLWKAADLTPEQSEPWAEGRYMPEEAAAHIAAGTPIEQAGPPKYETTLSAAYEETRYLPLGTLKAARDSAKRALDGEEGWDAEARLAGINKALREAQRKR